MEDDDSESVISNNSEKQEIFQFDDMNTALEAEPIKNSFSKIQKDDIELPIKNYSLGKRMQLEDFNVLSVIGKGAYGKVYLVREIETKQIFAMKVLKKASIVLHEQQTRNERSILKDIDSPFIVKLYYAFQSPFRLYLILTYCAGGELFTLLNRERMFSQEASRFYISELLLGIEHLHNLGIIYRDLKPENVMLDNDGHVKLTDFGLSKVAIDAHTVCGTIEFMAPEIIQEQPYGKVVDYWSLGIMLYDMLTGSPPFTGSNRKKIMENVLKKKPNFPKYLTTTSRDILTKLLKKHPGVRLGNQGVDQIKSHPFFDKLDWKKVLEKQYDPPYKPVLNDVLDTSNFAAEFTEMSSNSLLNDQLALVDTNPFEGFSFVASK
ncbi:Ribosomal protein S6 kinase beta-1 [Boothiomyces sp. JEL0866]|nr:Ribosomal protein S6 kinase beta-1 [Boothiomyces sp. JEL0866]